MVASGRLNTQPFPESGKARPYQEGSKGCELHHCGGADGRATRTEAAYDRAHGGLVEPITENSLAERGSSSTEQAKDGGMLASGDKQTRQK